MYVSLSMILSRSTFALRAPNGGNSLSATTSTLRCQPAHFLGVSPFLELLCESEGPPLEEASHSVKH